MATSSPAHSRKLLPPSVLQDSHWKEEGQADRNQTAEEQRESCRSGDDDANDQGDYS